MDKLTPEQWEAKADEVLENWHKIGQGAIRCLLLDEEALKEADISGAGYYEEVETNGRV